MEDNSKIRVLVVDDEPPIRSSLEGFLNDQDFIVSSAETAEEALEILNVMEFDVVIVDLRLPGMSGESLILRAHEIKPSMCYLIHTGSMGYRISKELEFIGLREEHVFMKPLSNLGILVDAILNLVQDKGDNHDR